MYLYHGTSLENAKKILKEGFNTKYVYATTSLENASRYGKWIIFWKENEENFHNPELTDWEIDKNALDLNASWSNVEYGQPQFVSMNHNVPIDKEHGLRLLKYNKQKHKVI